MESSSKPLILFGLVVVGVIAFFVFRPSVADSPYPENFELAQSRQQMLGVRWITEAERVVYCIRTFEKEVENGGFLQFLSSDAGDHTEETLDSLRLVGANESKRLLESAISALFRKRLPPEDLEERLKILDRINGRLEDGALDNLEELDSRFESSEDDLPSLVNTWLKR